MYKRQVQHKYTEIVKLLCSHGIDINATDSNNRTALHYAAANFGMEIIKILLSFGADVNIKDINNKTAGQIALDIPFPSIARLLLPKTEFSDYSEEDEEDN